MNKKSNQEFDVSTIKRIISNNINDLKKNMKSKIKAKYSKLIWRIIRIKIKLY